MTLDGGGSAFSDRQLAFLHEPGRYATLATLDADGTPHQVVIWFLVRGEAVVINSLVGRRWPANLLRDPRASLCVESGTDYVEIRGLARQTALGSAALGDILELGRRYSAPGETDEIIEARFRGQERISFLIEPRRVTGHGAVE